MKEVLIFVVILNFSSCQRAIIDPAGYMQKILENMKAQILVNPGDILKLSDFEEFFYTKNLDKVWNGTVEFHSGVVNRIGKFEFAYNLDQAWNETEALIRRTLTLLDFTISFDADVASEEYSTPSVFMFTFSSVEFYLEITRNHFEKQIKSSVTRRTENKYEVRNFPENAYTEIIAQEINPQRGTTPLKTVLIDSILGWTVILQKLAEKATKEVEFPTLCHYCPKLPWEY